MVKTNYIKKIFNTYDSDFYISKFNNTKFDMPYFHYHEEYEVYLALSDNVICFVGNLVYDVNKGDLLIFNSADVHRFYASDGEEYNRHIIQFRPEFINHFSTQQTNLLDCFEKRGDYFSHLVHLQDTQFDYLLKIFEELEAKSGKKLYGEDLVEKIKFIELLIYVNELYCTSVSIAAIPTNVMDSRIKEVIQYINENLAVDLTLNTLAAKIYLNKYYLNELFKKNTGFSINEYIILQRMFRAKQLLCEGISVTMCTELVGYTNQSHFIRMFKKVVGMPPKRFAKLKMQT